MSRIIQEDLATIKNSDLDYGVFKGTCVYLTGVTGMIGQYLKLLLESLNAKVITDLNDYYCDSYDYIIHAASPASSELYDKQVDVFSCNVVKTFNILNNTNLRKIKGFIFLSSGEAINPSNCYGEAKRSTELLLTYYHKQYNVPTYSVRLDHTFAPTVRLEKDKRIFSCIVQNILKRQTMVILNPRSVRTFTYITDAIDGIFRVLLKGSHGEIYNISNPVNRIKMNDLGSQLSEIYEGFLTVTGNDMHVTIKESLDITTLKELGYSPSVAVIDGFKRVIRHFKELENVK